MPRMLFQEQNAVKTGENQPRIRCYRFDVTTAHDYSCARMIKPELFLLCYV